MRLIYVVGAPKTGKSTYARERAAMEGATVISTDNYLDRPHAEQPDAVIGAIRSAGDGLCIVEGTTVARLLPHRADGTDHGAPRPDEVVWCRGPSEFDPRFAGLTAWITRMAEDYAKHEPITTRRLDQRTDAGPRAASSAARTRELVKLSRLMGMRRRPRKVIPRQLYPRALEASFGRMFSTIVKGFAEDLAPLYAALPEMFVQLKIEREDAERFDAGERIVISEILAQIEERMRARIRPDALRSGIARHADAVSDFQKRQIAAQVRAGLGVDVLINDAGVAGAVDDFIAESVATIRHVPASLTGSVERTVFDAFARGETYAETAGKIAKLLETTEEKAFSIAGQQVGKLNAKVTELRQRNIGVNAYTWRTARDEKVRKSHRAREGHRYTWDNPPNGETPGNAPGWHPCRCYPEPDFSELLGDE